MLYICIFHCQFLGEHLLISKLADRCPLLECTHIYCHHIQSGCWTYFLAYVSAYILRNLDFFDSRKPIMYNTKYNEINGAGFVYFVVRFIVQKQ